jgi:mono/diheme cytochrome c family protein
MRTALACFSVSVLATISFGIGKQEPTQEKPKENPPPAADASKPAGAERKNPVTPTAEGLASAKKMFGYDCAMCHGAAGDGKGDMVESMKLTMKDWRDPQSLSAIKDGELYEIITKGKGKMTGEGDRLPPEKVWGMVNYVRALAKKGGAAPAPDAAPKQ